MNDTLKIRTVESSFDFEADFVPFWSIFGLLSEKCELQWTELGLQGGYVGDQKVKQRHKVKEL
jgi:hypothetical protein